MDVVRTGRDHRCNSWTVFNGAKEYRVVNYWSVGGLRMTWLVEIYVKVAQGTSHWRRVSGLNVIAAVKEFENSLTPASPTQIGR